ncbi:MAG: dTMP kinase, partial [Hyphomicrobiales bacterium]
TKAYQGGAGGVPMAFIDAVDAQIVGKNHPDLTLVFDIATLIGLERAQARGGPDRFERKGLAFHEALREAFLAIADANPIRCRVVDASAPAEDIARDVWHLVSTRFGIEQ